MLLNGIRRNHAPAGEQCRARNSVGGNGDLFGVRFAQHPTDSEHRFGHGKGEALAAFTQAILLASTAVVLAAQSFWRLIFPKPFTAVALGLWIALCGLMASGLLATMQTWVVRRTGSTAIDADRAHYVNDTLPNGAVLAALVMTRVTRWDWADPVFALVMT